MEAAEGLSAQCLGNGLHNQYISIQGIYLIDHQLSQDREAIKPYMVERDQ